MGNTLAAKNIRRFPDRRYALGSRHSQTSAMPEYRSSLISGSALPQIAPLSSAAAGYSVSVRLGLVVRSLDKPLGCGGQRKTLACTAARF
jgi:hypothetical protein